MEALEKSFNLSSTLFLWLNLFRHSVKLSENENYITNINLLKTWHLQ